MVKSNKHYFYVLHCKDDTLYGGYTTDLDRRLEEHNSGLGAKYTRSKNRRPLRMVYAECFDSRSLATQREYAFKKQSRMEKDAELRARGVNLKDPKQELVVKDRREEDHADSKEL